MIDIVDTRTDIKSRKKSRILDSAALLFSRKQYHEVMIEDVARLALIAKGTVYNYFSSKEELYFTIISEKLENLITSLDQKIQSVSDSRSALRSFVIHLYMFMMKYSDFFLIYSKETLDADNQICSSINKRQDQLKEMLGDIIDSGIKSGVFRKMDSAFAAELALGNIYASVNRGIRKDVMEAEMILEREETFNFIVEGLSVNHAVLPLHNKVIVLTRTEEQNMESAPLFISAGARVISFPVLKIVPVSDADGILNQYLQELPEYIVLMSGNAVRIFAEKLTASDIRIDRKKTLVAAVGTKTAAQCIINNLTPDIIPAENSAAGLIEYFRNSDISGKKFLIPRSAQGRDEFINFLEEKNALPLTVNIYDTISPSVEEAAARIKDLFDSVIDIIVFASPSAFRNFLELTGARGSEVLRKINIAAIGKTTAEEIATSGFIVNIVPDDFTMEGVKNSIIDFYSRRDSDIKE